MLSSDALNPLINEAFTRQTTWLEASDRFPLDEFIETFFHTRGRVQDTLVGLTDAQVTFAAPAHPF